MIIMAAATILTSSTGGRHIQGPRRFDVNGFGDMKVGKVQHDPCLASTLRHFVNDHGFSSPWRFISRGILQDGHKGGQIGG